LLVIELVKENRFERIQLRPVLNRVFPDKGDFPNVDLSVGDHVGASRGQVSLHPLPNAILGLPDVNRNIVEVAQDIHSDLRGEFPNRLFAEREIR
jgi:hypothetical protein